MSFQTFLKFPNNCTIILSIIEKELVSASQGWLYKFNDEFRDAAAAEAPTRPAVLGEPQNDLILTKKASEKSFKKLESVDWDALDADELFASASLNDELRAFRFARVTLETLPTTETTDLTRQVELFTTVEPETTTEETTTPANVSKSQVEINDEFKTSGTTGTTSGTTKTDTSPVDSNETVNATTPTATTNRLEEVDKIRPDHLNCDDRIWVEFV
jgi:hypothetical protein